MRRRDLILAAGLAAGTSAGAERTFKLIAHRGGIVDDQHPENSPGSVQAAIERGYWMIEVDIRRTKDGEPILQHDPNFQRFYNEPRQVGDVTWKEVRQLRSTPGNTSPIHFSELCRMCAGKVRLMLDIKGENWPEDFYRRLIADLEKHSLLSSAYLLGPAKVRSMFRGKCFLSTNRASLSEAIARGEDVARSYYLFELASALQEPSFELCRKHGVVPVAAINTFRYTEAKRDETKGPEEDAARLKRMGVTHYQIDSRYDYLFP